jgi:hypothetical protein
LDVIGRILSTLAPDIITKVFVTGSKDWNKLLIQIMTTSDAQHNECKSISLKGHHIN